MEKIQLNNQFTLMGRAITNFIQLTSDRNFETYYFLIETYQKGKLYQFKVYCYKNLFNSYNSSYYNFEEDIRGSQVLVNGHMNCNLLSTEVMDDKDYKLGDFKLVADFIWVSNKDTQELILDDIGEEDDDLDGE